MPALVAALFAFALAWTSPAQTKLRGVVVETYGGISENGVQTTHLLTPGGEYMLHYGKRDFKPKFASATCEDIGAIWTITANLIKGHEADLLTAECDGSVDHRMHEPQRIVRLYLDHLSMFRHKEAAQLIAPRLAKSGDSFIMTESRLTDMRAKDLRSLIVASWWFSARSVSGSALRTKVSTVPDSHIRINGASVTITFIVSRATASSRWLIDSIEIE